MIGNTFHSIRNAKGITAIRANHYKATVALIFKSPYATVEDNVWLERKLLKLYNAYYLKVSMQAVGRFWDEKGQTITVDYGDGLGGMDYDWNKV